VLDGHSRAPVIISAVIAVAGLLFSPLPMPQRALLAGAVFFFVWLVLQAIFDRRR
jgi:inner membrane protein involved in colicin E2 resistance